MRSLNRTKLTIALLVSTIAVTAIADEIENTSRDLEACLENTPPDDLERCIGNLSNLCQSQPDGATTVGIVTCISSEEQAWDRLLNSYWADLKVMAANIDAQNADLGQDVPSAADSLLSAQRGWLRYRDGECTFRWLPYADGTIRGPISAGCRLRMTANRVIEFYLALSDDP